MSTVWHDGPKFCSLIEDDSRVLGQCVLIDATKQWRAFDNTKLNKSRTGALPLGIYATLEDAKQTVEAQP